MMTRTALVLVLGVLVASPAAVRAGEKTKQAPAPGYTFHGLPSRYQSLPRRLLAKVPGVESLALKKLATQIQQTNEHWERVARNPGRLQAIGTEGEFMKSPLYKAAKGTVAIAEKLETLSEQRVARAPAAADAVATQLSRLQNNLRNAGMVGGHGYLSGAELHGTRDALEPILRLNGASQDIYDLRRNILPK